MKLGLMGATIGLSAWAAGLELEDRIWIGLAYPLLGFLLGYFLRDLIGNWLSSAQDLGITELSFDFPLVGQTSISLTNAASIISTAALDLVR